MAIFLDSADMNEMCIYMQMGIIKGVTTNPTILRKAGIVGEFRDIEVNFRRMAEFVKPLPLSVEVTSNVPLEIITQAQMITEHATNINIKVPIHGPNCELENLEIIHRLETIHNIRVNVTAMMSDQQCFLPATAGATYISIFGCRVNNMGYNVCTEITKLRNVLEQEGLKSQIIVGSTREVLNVMEWLEAGAHIVTVSPDILKGMIVHPYTKETVQMFLHDATI